MKCVWVRRPRRRRRPHDILGLGHDQARSFGTRHFKVQATNRVARALRFSVTNSDAAVVHVDALEPDRLRFCEAFWRGGD